MSFPIPVEVLWQLNKMRSKAWMGTRGSQKRQKRVTELPTLHDTNNSQALHPTPIPFYLGPDMPQLAIPLG